VLPLFQPAKKLLIEKRPCGGVSEWDPTSAISTAGNDTFRCTNERFARVQSDPEMVVSRERRMHRRQINIKVPRSYSKPKEELACQVPSRSAGESGSPSIETVRWRDVPTTGSDLFPSDAVFQLHLSPQVAPQHLSLRRIKRLTGDHYEESFQVVLGPVQLHMPRRVSREPRRDLGRNFMR
jgi:hypothetical protein